MGAEAKKYLHDHRIPQLFEGLMTGLIYNKPDNPIEFIEISIAKIKNDPSLALKWDSFVDSEHLPSLKPSAYPLSNTYKNNKTLVKNESAGTVKKSEIIDERVPRLQSSHSNKFSSSVKSKHSENKSIKDLDSPKTNRERCASVMKAAEIAQIPNVPIILFMGGPGGGKTKHAARIRESMENKGLIHICMPDLIKMAINRYSDKYPEWKNAGEKYSRGELIPNYLALQLIKAEMGRYQNAKAFFLEGFPREAQQVEDFEREVAPVNMALILDYDEGTLRSHMEKRGLSLEVINCKINEFKKKTLPSAKYFDDQGLLHLIPGENSNEEIFDKLSVLVNEAMEYGIPIKQINSPVHIEKKVESRNTSSKSKKSDNSITSEKKRSFESEKKMTKQITKTDSMATINSRKSNDSRGTPSTPAEYNLRNERNLNNKENDTISVNNDTNSIKTENKNEHNIESNIVASNSSHVIIQPETPKEEKNIEDEVMNREVTSDTRPSTLSQRPPSSTIKTVTAVIEKNERNNTGENKNSPSITPTLTAKEGITINVPVILIIGPPGSNKTEISNKISQKYEGFTYLSMGELLRNMVEENKNDELWQRIGKKMEVGEMIPMKICRELLFSALTKHVSTAWGFVIEGYPRSLPQLSDYETHGIRLDLAILIDCTEQFCIENLSKRFNIDDSSKKRPDDDPDIVKARLEHFKQNNLPMLKALDDTGKLRVVRIEYKIDGDTETEQIFNNITDIIDTAIFVEENNAGKGLSTGNSNNTHED